MKSIEDHIQFIRSLKKPTENQALLVSLHAKAERTPTEDRLLLALLRSESAADRALKARTAAGTLVRAKHKALAIANRRARQQRLIALGELIDMAGLQNRSQIEVLGLLVVSNNITEATYWQNLSQVGSQVLMKHQNTLHERTVQIT